MKNVMKRALALMLGLVITLATAETSVAYAAPGHYQGSSSYSNYFTKKHAHVFNRAVTEKWTEATCDSYATQTWACSQYVTKNGVKVLCEEEVTVISGNKLPHNYVSTATEESEGVYQCACGAVEYEMCKNCAEYRIFGRYHVPHMITKVAPKLPHTHVEVTDAAVEATCTTTGLTEGKHCATCGEVFAAQEAVEATGHAWDEGEIRLAATCEHEGVTKYTCMNCGEEKFVDTAIAAHTWATVAAKDATCTENGYEAYEMCTVCGFHGPIYSIDAIGHDAVVDAAVEATCTTTGLTEGSHCGTCGEVLVAQEVIPMEEHAWYVVLEYIYCEAEGVRYYKCEAKCGANKEEAVAPTGHSYETVAALAPTCTEEGHTEYSICTTCGKDWKFEVLPALGHAWDEGKVVYAPGCTTVGETYYKCENGCGADKTEYPAAVGHTWTTVAAKEATCAEEGHYEYSLCTTCGMSTKDINTIPATGHTEVVVPGYAATCKKAGLTDGKNCSTCGEVLVAQEVVPMEEHAWYVTKEYSYCEIEGTRYYKCEAKCGAFKEEVVAPLGHNKATVAAVEATCTEDGHTEYTMCTTCGNSWGYVVIPATGHTEVVVPGYAATCKKAGLTDGKNCSTCGEVLVAQEVIDASAEYHDWVATSSDDPCSLNPGETKLVTYRCSVCNRGMGKEISYAPHTYGTVAAKAPTCTEAGYKEYTMCTTCGLYWNYEEIPATGHVVVVDSEAVAAIGTQHGWSQASHCGTCNEVLEERKEVCAWAADVADCPYGCMKAK